MRDVRYALRRFGRYPSVAILAIGTMAIGIAASTSVFTLADAVLWHPLPFKDPERIVSLWSVQAPGLPATPRVPLASLEAWTAKADVLERVYAFSPRPGVIEAGEPESVPVCEVSPGLLSSLGMLPISGRDFAPDDAAPGGDDVAIVSARLARTLGLEAGGPNSTITVDGTRRNIVGVMPPGFSFPTNRAALWLPLSQEARGPGPARVTAMARLRPGVSLARARATAEVATNGLVDARGRHLASIRLAPFVEPDATTTTALCVLLGAVALLFLIAVGNASGVQLAEAVRRDAEMALRTSLGATRWRLARQVLAESLLLAGCAALAGAGLASWVISGAAPSVPSILSFQSLRPIQIDWRALTFLVLAALVAGVASALASISRIGRRDLRGSLDRAGSQSAGHTRFRSVFTVTQLAFTLVLLMGAGLLGNGFVRLMRADPGYRPAGVHLLSLDLPERWFPDKAGADSKLEEMRREVASLPDVTSATVSDSAPPDFGFMAAEAVETSDGNRIGRTDDVLGLADVDGAYFATLGIPLLSGRTFDDRDRPAGQPTTVISRSLAARLWPGRDPLGRHFRTEGGPWLTVIGIAGDVANGGMDQPLGTLVMYVPRAQQARTRHRQTLIARMRSGATAAVASLRSVVRRTLPEAPIDNTETAYAAIADSNARVRFATGLMATFAAVALGLALIGVYGSFWCAVRQRTSEIGVRMALGASPQAIMNMVLSGTARLVALGALIGTPIALAGARMLRSLLFEVSPYDPVTFGLVVLALALAALAATYLPARAASRIDPLAALRHL